MKYEHNEDVDLYTLSWSTKDFGNILASGSNTGEIRLFDMEREVSFHNWIYKKKIPINAAQFHSEESSWLMTASKVTRILHLDVLDISLSGWDDLSLGYRGAGPSQVPEHGAQDVGQGGVRGEHQGPLQHGLGGGGGLRLAPGGQHGRSGGLEDFLQESEGEEVSSN